MKVLRICFMLLFLVGLGVLVYPDVQGVLKTHHQQQEIVAFKQKRKQYPDVLKQLQDYNEMLYQNGQREIEDAFDFETQCIQGDTPILQNDIFGYIQIDKMKLVLPLYIGTSYEHLQNGAAILGKTSMPIGGNNTNSVIAAHRGTYASRMFIDIELLEPGDLISIYNPWECLKYEVVASCVVKPDDISSILIRKDADMITLMSCHPFPASTHRYLVYCQRVGSDFVDLDVEQTAFVSSQKEIDAQEQIHNIVLGFVGVFMVVLLGGSIYKKLRKK